MSGARYGATLGVTLLAVLWTLLVALVMAWGAADAAAATLALLAAVVVVVTPFLRRVPAVWVLLLTAVAAVIQVALCWGSVFGLDWEEVEEPSATFAAVFLVLGAMPAVVALAAVSLALTGRVEAGSERTFALIALCVLGGGSYVFWLFGLAATEGSASLVDGLFYALLIAGPVALYSAAAAIVTSAVGRPAPVRYRSWTGEPY